ncbi:hypothetical protein SLS62_010852 [Diatrype stigma]|uniref:Cytochrome P450 n=1 Tax=Diatrype stigma TaxID=117547 RepID=A0AAN9UFL2_9PEZI
MPELVQLSYVVLAVVSLLFLNRLLPRNDPKKDKLWSKINKVGVPSKFLPWTRAVFGSWTALLRNTHEGYQRFCKKDLPFALPTIWTGKAVVVLPPSALHLTNRPDSELIAFWALVDNIQLPYFIPDRDVIENVIHFEVSRKDLTKRNVHRQLARRSKRSNPASIIARVALRTLLGSPACRDEKVVKATQSFANKLFSAAAIINCMPPLFRPILAPILALPTKRYRNQYRKVVVPLIKERILLWEQHEKTGEGELPSDFLQWLIPRAAQHGRENLDPSKLSYRLLALNTMFVYAMSFVFAQTVIDICASPDHKRFMDGMVAECKAVAARYPDGLASSEAVEQLHRVDSAIRESMRISDVGVVTMPRDVVGNKPLDLGNGIICPPGTRLMYPTQPIHMDPDFWEDPLRFNAFRFSDPFDTEAETSSPAMNRDGTPKQRESLVDLTPSFLARGFGKKACPGRYALPWVTNG